MPTFKVTTAVTAYEAYTLDAVDEADARRQVSDPQTRAALALVSSWPAGQRAEEEIIDIARVDG